MDADSLSLDVADDGRGITHDELRGSPASASRRAWPSEHGIERLSCGLLQIIPKADKADETSANHHRRSRVAADDRASDDARAADDHQRLVFPRRSGLNRAESRRLRRFDRC